PLLCNMNSTLQAMPNATLPVVDQKALLDDARWQVAEAMKFYKEQFGTEAKGIWPAEGSVAPSMVPLLVEQGVNYFAADEEILAQTLGKSSDHLTGFLNDLYQPYRMRNMAVIFRDQNLSDLIGFQYQRWKPQDAVDHLINEIKSGASRVHQEAPLVSIILDGENPWEYYPDNGIEFLRMLYERLSNDPEIETVRISDYLQAHPPVKELDTIYAGSWINHNFSIWVGHNEDRQAWEYLAKTREAIKDQITKGAEQAVIDKAMESIYIAEGSDWFWWFGHEHSSALDDQFDLLFRKHLMSVYQILGVNVPEYLHHQIKARRQKELHTLPWGLLDIKLDGKRSDYFEWLAAGQFDTASEGSATMDRSFDTGKIISSIFFGFDKNNICLRVDPPADSARTQKANDLGAFPDGIYFVLNFLKPLKRKVIIRDVNAKPRFNILDENNKVIKEALDTVASSEIAEILCPLDILGFNPGDSVEFFIEAYFILGGGDKPSRYDIGTQDRLIVRHPDSQPIKLTVPAEDLAHIDWMA
ncbi:MAG: glycoside hydrolase family 57 protein, partial [Planctomycetota bacterium]